MDKLHIEKEIPVTIVKNELIHDENLRYEDVGLLVYILSKSEKDGITFNDLVNSHKNSRAEVTSIIKNLIEKGYFKKYNNKLTVKDYIFIQVP